MSFKKVQAKIAAREGVSKKNAGAILAAATRRAGPEARAKNPKLNRVKGGPPPSSYAKDVSAPKPPAPAKGPGPQPAPGQLVREGINYKDLSPSLQAQMAKQAGLVPDAPALPPGVTPPEQEAATESANEQEGMETKAKADLEVPHGHTAVSAHTRKLPMSKVGRAKLKRRGVTPSDE